MNDRRTTFAGVLFAVAGVVASLPPIPVFRDWTSAHIAAIIAAVAGGMGFHFAADAAPVKGVADADKPSGLP